MTFHLLLDHDFIGNHLHLWQINSSAFSNNTEFGCVRNVSWQIGQVSEILLISSCVKMYGVFTTLGLMHVLQYHFVGFVQPHLIRFETLVAPEALPVLVRPPHITKSMLIIYQNYQFVILPKMLRFIMLRLEGRLCTSTSLGRLLV